MKTYYNQMTREVEEAAKTMGRDELMYHMMSCDALLAAGGIDEEEREQIKKERSTYERHLNNKLGIFPGSGHGIQKPN